MFQLQAVSAAAFTHGHGFTRRALLLGLALWLAVPGAAGSAGAALQGGPDAQGGIWVLWGYPEPYRDLFSVVVLSSADAWAVGSGATILHWNGSSWTRVPSPYHGDLYSVAMVSPANGWAVGAGGTILHWNGIAWSEAPSPTTNYLSSVSMVSAADGWAVGSGGTILHWDGRAWSQASSPTGYPLNSVAMVAADDGWTVGLYDMILHWNGIGWVYVPPPMCPGTPLPPLPSLYAVAMNSSDDGWAVGNLGYVLHWDGAAWTFSPHPELTRAAYAVTTLPATGEAWIMAGDPSRQGRRSGADTTFFPTVIYWDGSTWTPQQITRDNAIFSVAMASPTDGWAVGAWGAIFRYVPAERIRYLPLAAP